MAHAEVENAADPGQVKRAGRRLTRAEEKRKLAVQKQLSSYDGRAFLWAELERHAIYDVVIGSAEAIMPWLGRRNAGIELLTECYQWPALFLEMQKEAIARKDRADGERDAGYTKTRTNEDDA